MNRLMQSWNSAPPISPPMIGATIGNHQYGVPF